MESKVKNLKYFFDAKSVAIIGASHDPRKIGYIILKNFVSNKYKGLVYPVNPKGGTILGTKVYKSILDIAAPVELAVIATPAETVPKIVEACVYKKVKAIIVISSGFSEIGREDLEQKVKDALKNSNTRLIGVNCIGVYSPKTGIDSMFLPDYRLGRPPAGSIAYITQSGAVGSTTLDWASQRKIGISKFISYGNATDVQAHELLEYLGDDPETKVILMYLEGLREGRKFYEIAKKVSKKKPIVILKGGKTAAGHKATLSHTASLAGNIEVYRGMFKQTGIIEAKDVEELFDIARILEKQPLPKGDRVQIITDGGGFGVIAADELHIQGLKLAEMEDVTKAKIKEKMPTYAIVSNPLDLTGDADEERYMWAINAALKDKNVDSLIVILLFQVPSVAPDIVETLTALQKEIKKPMVLISAGAEFTEVQKKFLEANGVPCFDYPTEAISALSAVTKYAMWRQNH